MKELEFLSELRCGEKHRDASPTIRGYLYQDLLALDLLLSETGDLCLEYIEDICLFSANRVCFYQVKYYPKSILNSLTIARTLFYQYIRSQMIDKKSEIIKQLEIYLFYYSNKEIEFVSDNFERDMKAKFPESKIPINDEDLIDKINEMDNMEKREELLFSNRSNKYMQDFIKIIKFVKKEDFQNVKRKVKENIKSIIINGSSFLLNEENILDIMFSLGMSMIREKYCLDNDDIEMRIINQETFLKKCEEVLNKLNKPSEVILSLLDSYMIDILIEINETDEISEETFKLYQHLYESTKKYISEILKTVEGQRKLLNTYSMIKIEDLNECFDNYDSNNVIKKFIEEKGRFDSFIMLTWKILFDINCNEFDKYINSSNNEYIQFDFPGEINNVQIMTSAFSGRVTNDLTRIFERIQTQKEKPRKWYFKNSRRGILDYSIDISQIKPENNIYEIDVIDHSEKFYLECLSCIKIDQDEFDQRDNCSECIFNEECVEGKMK